ncbi:MAG: hypothetical protein KC505_06905 [Myxococcales bacterium]|nr:hypothetical protein [Myxococcales bacterium]USN51320.1 MAG: hypothetical protein H6731_02630 [Myxococcales bacterium]
MKFNHLFLTFFFAILSQASSFDEASFSDSDMDTSEDEENEPFPPHLLENLEHGNSNGLSGLLEADVNDANQMPQKFFLTWLIF